jgi:hypothetical protein
MPFQEVKKGVFIQQVRVKSIKASHEQVSDLGVFLMILLLLETSHHFRTEEDKNARKRGTDHTV